MLRHPQIDFAARLAGSAIVGSLYGATLLAPERTSPPLRPEGPITLLDAPTSGVVLETPNPDRGSTAA